MITSVTNGVFLRDSGRAEDTTLWLLHGFADSGLAFRKMFKTSLADNFRLLAPDLPGFGVSRLYGHGFTIGDQVAALLKLIDTETPDGAIGFVGHSTGSILAVEAARELKGRCAGVFSIEGNLTEADAYFSGQAAEYDDADTFKREFSTKMWAKGEGDIIFRHYHASIQFADATAMWEFGRDVRRTSAGDRPGHAFRDLDAPALYYWCEANTPETSVEFIAANGLGNETFRDASHWPMLDDPSRVAAAAGAFFRGPA